MYTTCTSVVVTSVDEKEKIYINYKTQEIVINSPRQNSKISSKE